MRIVLIQSPHTEAAWNSQSFPPLGLLYLAGALSPYPQFDVRIIDAGAEGLGIEQTAGRALALRPDLVGVSITSRNFEDGRALLALIRQRAPGVRTLFGGIHATLFDDLLLRESPWLDYVIRGEGEEAFAQLCLRLHDNAPVRGIPGLSHRHDNELIRGQPQRIANLDALPFPDRSLLTYPGYASQWYGFSLPKLPKMATAFSSRGCPFHCTFCSDTMLSDGKIRTRSAANVYAELQILAAQGYGMVVFFDDNLTVKRNRLRELCTMLIEQPLGLRLACAGTLHTLTLQELRMMRKAGFDIVFLGVESGSDAQLARYRKPVRSKDLARTLRWTRRTGFMTIASFITGHAQETVQDHQATLHFLRALRPFIGEINPLMIHPGSTLWSELQPRSESLEQTHSRLVSRFPGQHAKQTIASRQQDFRRTFQQTWMSPLRIADIANLLVRNPTTRLICNALISHPVAALQLVKGADTKR